MLYRSLHLSEEEAVFLLGIGMLRQAPGRYVEAVFSIPWVKWWPYLPGLQVEEGWFVWQQAENSGCDSKSEIHAIPLLLSAGRRVMCLTMHITPTPFHCQHTQNNLNRWKIDKVKYTLTQRTLPVNDRCFGTPGTVRSSQVNLDVTNLPNNEHF